MTTVGLIGSGYLGGTVARLAVAAGCDVVLSNSRGPQTLKDLVEELGPRARAVPVQPLAGKSVLDTINYIAQRDGRIAGLDDGWLSSSEVLQRHLGPRRWSRCSTTSPSGTSPGWLARPARPTGAPCRSPGTTRPPRPR
jgi:hypothetical protein